MSVHANFDSQDYKDITGYKISACLQVNNRIQDSFFVYIEQVIAPQFDFAPLNMDVPDATEGNKRGTLIISDDNNYRNYKFDNIDLVDYQIHFSHFRKVRLLTFRYSPEITNNGSFCTLTNNQSSKDSKSFRNKFAQTYMYSIQGQGSSESLLSISSKFTRNSNEYIRFGTQRTKDNSFMDLAIKLDEEIPTGGIQSKTITYKGLSATIDKDNFVAIIVDETYGSFLPYSLPPLDEVSVSSSYTDLLKIKYDPLSPFEYLKHAVAPPAGGSIIDNSFSSSIETAVLILENGTFLDHSKSMV
ncbi:hypothetical protein [Taibaiella koreensis]|uniref:hypothetical protein n=1 Tax=Taibaiella koreensis TaxID=1268548 RepID=UPI000E59B54C|nr:hypothetical protein [Taibaiella koreensis]